MGWSTVARPFGSIGRRFVIVWGPLPIKLLFPRDILTSARYFNSHSHSLDSPPFQLVGVQARGPPSVPTSRLSVHRAADKAGLPWGTETRLHGGCRLSLERDMSNFCLGKTGGTAEQREQSGVVHSSMRSTVSAWSPLMGRSSTCFNVASASFDSPSLSLLSLFLQLSGE